MKDIITYCNDTEALVAELLASYPDRVNNTDISNPRFLIDKAPGTIRNGDETLSLVRVDDTDLAIMESLTSITILGTYDEVFADTAKTAIYDRVYDQTPITDEDDNVRTPPRKFVVFA